jgi:hypothetical protein
VSEPCLEPVGFDDLIAVKGSRKAPMTVAASPRKFTSGHFAFMRAVVQGIDIRVSWDRYLRTGVQHENLRCAMAT